MATVIAAEPQLYVRDIDTSCAFYSRLLGFAVAFVYGEPPFYGQVFRGGARLNLRQVDFPLFDDARRDGEQLLAASITLEDAEPLFQEYQEAGVEFVQPLRSEPWGARTPDASSSGADRHRDRRTNYRGIRLAIPRRPVPDVGGADRRRAATRTGVGRGVHRGALLGIHATARRRYAGVSCGARVLAGVAGAAWRVRPRRLCGPIDGASWPLEHRTGSYRESLLATVARECDSR